MNHNTKLSVDDVKALVQSTTYTRSPSGKAIICEMVLTTGWACHGVARVVDLENYAEQLGKEAAHAKAMQEVFDYAAVQMQEAMHAGLVPNRHKELMAEYTASVNNQPTVI
jgi:hypothetical protein